jgi:DNA polymerase IV
MILHLRIPDFPIAVARVVDAALRGRPVAIAAGQNERALLQAVSAEARAEGVHEGTPLYRARRFCPSLAVITPDPGRSARAMAALTEAAGRYTPLWEPVTAGRLYLDLTGCARLLGPGRDAAARLEREIASQLRLCGAVGVASNKLVSGIAAGYLERPGVCDVLRGSEENFIAPLPVSVLPGVGPVREGALLRELNLRRVADVSALCVAQLRLAFGPFAPLLHQRARGIDPSPVRPPQRVPEVAEESILERADNDDDLLRSELCRLVEGCGFTLRRQKKGAGRLCLTIDYADGRSERAQSTFDAPEDGDDALLAAAEALFERACTRRVRVKRMRLLCDRLAAADRQLCLFTAPSVDPRRVRLQEALDVIRGRHGMGAVKRQF